MASVPSSPVIRQADLRQTCTVCMESLLPPVFQCRRGHLMCEGCYSKLKNCGVCRAILPQVDRVRSLEVERIIRMLQHPCPNETDGCQAKRLKYDQLEAHRIECDFRKFSICELVFGLRHCEEVRGCEYEEHYERMHGSKLVVGNTEPSTLPATRCFQISTVDFVGVGYFSSFKLQLENKTILFVVHVEVDAANDLLKCKPWVLDTRAVANQLDCKISFLSGKDVKVSMDSSVFDLQTKKEELRACVTISLTYYRTKFPNKGKNLLQIELWKKTGTLPNVQASSAMDVSST